MPAEMVGQAAILSHTHNQIEDQLNLKSLCS